VSCRCSSLWMNGWTSEFQGSQWCSLLWEGDGQLLHERQKQCSIYLILRTALQVALVQSPGPLSRIIKTVYINREGLYTTVVSSCNLACNTLLTKHSEIRPFLKTLIQFIMLKNVMPNLYNNVHLLPRIFYTTQLYPKNGHRLLLHQI
jgi:hypothetical protein